MIHAAANLNLFGCKLKCCGRQLNPRTGFPESETYIGLLLFVLITECRQCYNPNGSHAHKMGYASLTSFEMFSNKHTTPQSAPNVTIPMPRCSQSHGSSNGFNIFFIPRKFQKTRVHTMLQSQCRHTHKITNLQMGSRFVFQRRFT